MRTFWNKKIYGLSRGRRFPPDLKSILIHLNIVLDHALLQINKHRWEWYSFSAWHRELTSYEIMVLLLEDRRYFRHGGVDFWCIPRVLRQIVTLKRIGGVSTIEQQFIRTVLRSRDRTFARKARELFLAWVLTHRAEKREVLYTYLRIAYFGYRLRGAEQASMLIFGVSPEELDDEQAAFIASLLVYPLPKVVKELAERLALHPVGDLDHYLSQTAAVAPNWTRKVQRRYRYGLYLLSNTKKALY